MGGEMSVFGDKGRMKIPIFLFFTLRRIKSLHCDGWNYAEWFSGPGDLSLMFTDG